MYQRQIYCNFEGAMVSKWSDTDLTTCPNNVSHSVASGSTSIINVARLQTHLAHLFATNSTSYVNVCKFVYQGSDFYANDAIPPKYLKITGSIGAGSYDLRLIDPSSNVLWGVTGYTNTTDQTVSVDFDLLSPPSTETILTLQTKTSGSTLNIGNVSLFNAFVPE